MEVTLKLKKMQFKDYCKIIANLVKEHPECLDYEVIYSHDDEGNEYQKVNNTPWICQIHDIKEYRNLELVGYFEEGKSDIDKKDCNAVMIN